MKSILLAVLLLLQISSPAQQCGYDHYYLFPLHIHQPGNNELVKNLKIYLTDENGKAVTAEVLYQESRVWKTRRDTLFGWVNESLKKEDGSRPLIRRNFYNIGKVYIVVFWMDISKMKDPLRRPLFRLQIEGGESRDGFRYQSQSVHVSLNKALWLCNNGILDNFPPSRPVEHLDHQPYQPIDIVLQKEEMQMAEDPRETMGPIYQLRPYYEMSTNPAAYNRTERILQGVKVFDTRSGKVQQDIPISSDLVLFEETYQQAISTYDFYQRHLKEALDFAVELKRWRDTVFAAERTQTDFYVFNAVKKQYEKDTLLSRYPDTRYYPGLKTFRRIEYLLTPTSKLRNTYELKDTSWKLIDKIEELFPTYQPKPTHQPSRCVYAEEKYHRLQVQVLEGTNAVVSVNDSFRIYNACDQPLRLLSVKSPTRDFFSIPSVIPPKKYGTLLFKGEIQNKTTDWLQNSFQCYLELEDHTVLSFTIEVPTLRSSSQQAKRPNGTLAYAYSKSTDQRFSRALLTDEDGYLMASGMVLDGDSTMKAGRWQYYNRNDWRYNETTYSKMITLAARNEIFNDRKSRFGIQLRENGQWIKPEAEWQDGMATFYIKEGTDSILAFHDSLSYGFRLSYKDIPEQSRIEVFLLKAGQRSIKVGHVRTPFTTNWDNYTIIPDYSVFKIPGKTSYQLADSLLSALQKEFPKIASVIISRNVSGFSLEALKKDEKEKMLARLVNDKRITFVCQLFSFSDRPMNAFCENRVYVTLQSASTEAFKKTAAAIGFTNMYPDMGNNRYWLTYDSKLIDEKFFNAFQQLTELEGVETVYFNVYREPEVD